MRLRSETVSNAAEKSTADTEVHRESSLVHTDSYTGGPQEKGKGGGSEGMKAKLLSSAQT